VTKETLLLRLKEWKQKCTPATKSKGNIFTGLVKTKSAEIAREMARLRKDAVGDSKVEESKRVYVYGSGPPNFNSPVASVAQLPRKPFYFSKVYLHS
jgi:hypothetical protein